MAEWVQVIIGITALILGGNYLKVHNKKIKEERRLQFIYDAKKLLFDLRESSINLYEFPIELIPKSKIEKLFTPSKLLEDHITNFLIKEKEKSRKISHIKNEILTLLSLTQNKDIIKDFNSYIDIYKEIEKSYKSARFIIENYTTEVDIQNAINKIPLSFDSKDFEATKSEEDLYSKIQEKLTKEYLKKIS
jgi:hypothetical protein